MKPYFEHAGLSIYHADAREWAAQSSTWFDVLLTDPVWPNAAPELKGSEDPRALLTDVLTHFTERVRRMVIHLGQTSDPRILAAVPPQFQFFRCCMLEFARPIRLGRVLYSGDVAYVYGVVPRSKPGGRVLPGRTVTKYLGRTDEHPCPRQLAHVDWLVYHYAEGAILDPFMGRGTTLSAALRAGLPATGVEIEERYCEIAASRLLKEASEGKSHGEPRELPP